MYALGTKSKQKLATVHPDLARVIALAITLSPQDFTVLETLRTEATQREYVRTGASQTMDSRHLPGPNGKARAADLGAYVAGMVRWEWDLYPPIADAMRRAAIQLNIPVRWGGAWVLLNDLGSLAAVKRAVAQYTAARKAQRKKAFLDGPHFELPKSARYP